MPGTTPLVLRRPVGSLVACALVSLVAVWLATGVELRSSRAELAPAGDPDQQRFDDLLREFRGTEVVVAALRAGDGVTPRQLRDAADLVAAALAAAPIVERTFHRIDVDWLADRSVWLAPPETLEQIAALVEAEQIGLQALLEAPSLAAANDLLAARLESAAVDAVAPGPQRGARAVETIRAALAAELRWLESARATTDAVIERSALGRLVEFGEPRLADPYVSTHDGRLVLIAITPRDQTDSRAGRRSLIAGLRAVADRALTGRDVRIGFAGTTAMAVEEMTLVRRDTRRGALVALLGVSLLTMLVFRWRSHALLVLLTIGLGVLWSYGAVRLEYGYLNLITSAFVSTLIGVGVAYGIHPMSEYELLGAHADDPAAAVREAFRRTGRGVVAAGLTTSAAFFSILLMKFRGFAELGLVAGVGVLLCLAAALVALPAMMTLHGRWLSGRASGRDVTRHRAAIDVIWGDWATDWICRMPRTIVALAAAISLASAALATGLRFDTDLMKLLPDGSESVEIQRALIERSDLSPVFNLAVVDSLDEVLSIRERARAEPAIDRVESVLELLPADPERSRRAADRLRAAIGGTSLPEQPTSLRPGSLVASLERLEGALADAGEAAFVAGIGELAGPLEQARSAAEACAARAARATGAEIATWNREQDRLWRWARRGLHEALGSLAAGPHGVDAIPSSLRGRLVTSRGRFAVYIHPAGNALDPERLDAYVAASHRVAPDAIGFPSMFHKMSRLVWNGFRMAVFAGALIVLLILWIDLRRIDHTLLAVVPLGIGILWMLGGMRLFGLDFNFANLVALPLVIGVGIDNGVHVIHRLRLEGSEGMNVILRHTGRAILIASCTTMIGFGSLALASHRGLAGLGTVLLLGVGSCLLTSTVVLPNLLLVTGRVRR